MSVWLSVICNLLTIIIIFLFTKFRPLAFIKKCQNGTLKVYIQRIWLQFFICLSHLFDTFGHQFVCQKMFMSPLSLPKRMEPYWVHSKLVFLSIDSNRSLINSTHLNYHFILIKTENIKNKSHPNMMMLVCVVNEMHLIHFSIVHPINWL